MTTLGRTVSEAYHRLTTLTAEARRNIDAERLAAATGARPAYRSEAEVQAMYRHAESIIYPSRVERVMKDD